MKWSIPAMSFLWFVAGGVVGIAAHSPQPLRAADRLGRLERRPGTKRCDQRTCMYVGVWHVSDLGQCLTLIRDEASNRHLSEVDVFNTARHFRDHPP